MNTSKWITLLSIIGIILSGYLTYVHYAPEYLDASFCDINDYLSCSSVNKSTYSTFLGIPVALIGVLGFMLIGFLSLEKVKYSRVGIFYSSLLGLLFMLYLLVAELFLIKAICLYCIATLVAIALIFIISAVSFGRESIRFVKEIRWE